MFTPVTPPCYLTNVSASQRTVYKLITHPANPSLTWLLFFILFIYLFLLFCFLVGIFFFLFVVNSVIHWNYLAFKSALLKPFRVQGCLRQSATRFLVWPLQQTFLCFTLWCFSLFGSTVHLGIRTWVNRNTAYDLKIFFSYSCCKTSDLYHGLELVRFYRKDQESQLVSPAGSERSEVQV